MEGTAALALAASAVAVGLVAGVAGARLMRTLRPSEFDKEQSRADGPPLSRRAKRRPAPSVASPACHPGGGRGGDSTAAAALLPWDNCGQPAKMRRMCGGAQGQEARGCAASPPSVVQHRLSDRGQLQLAQARGRVASPSSVVQHRRSDREQLQLAQAVTGRLSPIAHPQLTSVLSPRRLLQYEERMRHMATADALATARREVEAKAGALKDASRGVKSAEDMLSAAVEAKRQKRAELSALKQESDAFSLALNTSFALLSSKAWLRPDEAQCHAAKVQQVGRRMGLEADLLNALPLTASKRPCDRGPHDFAILRSLEASLSHCSRQLEGRLARSSRAALESLDAVPRADAAVEASKEHQRKCYQAFCEAVSLQKRLEKARPHHRCDWSRPQHRRSLPGRLCEASASASAGATPSRPTALEDAPEAGRQAGLEAPELVPFWDEQEEPAEETQQPESQDQQDAAPKAQDQKDGASKADCSQAPEAAEGRGNVGRRRAGGRRGCSTGAAAPEEPKALSLPERLMPTAVAMLVVLANGDGNDLSGLRGISAQDADKILAARQRSGPLEDLVYLPRILGRRMSMKKLLEDNESA